MDKHLVLGMGQIGSAVSLVLQMDSDNIVDGLDRKIDFIKPEYKYDFLHVCIPYNNENDFFNSIEFIKKSYMKEEHIIIVHGTVPIGTSNKLCSVSSPVRGVHPYLKEGIMKFTKYFGGRIEDGVREAAFIFKKLGIYTEVSLDSRSVEAAKLWDTTQYGWQIILMHNIKQYCDENGLNFDIIYSEWNENYNDVYSDMGRKDVVRPHLKYIGGKIGGHCVIPNCKLIDSFISKTILEQNEKL